MKTDEPVNAELIEEEVNYKDLNDEDKQRVISLPFKDFKLLFDWKELKFNEAVVLVMAVRQFVENTHSQNHTTIFEGHKKHAWLSQKVFDLLKVNSIYTLKSAAEARLGQLKADQEAGKELSVEDAKAVEMLDTKAAQPSEESSARRFHVVPGTKS